MSTLEPAVLEWMNRVLHPDEVVGAERLTGDYINENIAITTNSNRYVLRRYQRSDAIAEKICAIEAALARRLAGTAVPLQKLFPQTRTGRSRGGRTSAALPFCPRRDTESGNRKGH